MPNVLKLVELFSSIQGEGLFVGYRQVFVRLAGCNIVCNYCDTPPESFKTAYLESYPGSRVFIEKNNPLAIENVADMINTFLDVSHHSVSLTGGEPLCQAEAIAQLAPSIKGRLFLETNGTMPEQLELVLPYIYIISMDLKLPSATGKVFWNEHKKFLLKAKKTVIYVKIVVTDHTTAEEFSEATELIKNIDCHIPLVIQPVTPVQNVAGVAPKTILLLYERAANVLTDVRVIPQTHKLMALL